MRVITLQIASAETKEQAHAHIAEALGFPSWYGGNLDALYDCLTDLHEDVRIELAWPREEAPAADWFDRFRRVFMDVAEENRHLSLAFSASSGAGTDAPAEVPEEGSDTFAEAPEEGADTFAEPPESETDISAEAPEADAGALPVKKRIAVVFPGIGYTCDRSLLYYAARLAASAGYEVVTVPYRNFPRGVKGNRKKMVKSFELAMEQTEELLKDICWEDYAEILFIGKSVGTIVASAFAMQKNLSVRAVWFTPLEDTFRFAAAGRPAIAFHGTADPWADTEAVIQACRDWQIPLYLTAHANHSLETGNVGTDLKTLSETMQIVSGFVK